ncbi:MAG: type I methionyl aminopeptidase [Clostridia bacterium]|nr:type I methionyl aminopeptidase [Clostridia bacterium]
MITLKSPKEIKLMREAGAIADAARRACGAAVEPGITTYELDAIARKVIEGYGARPSFLNYNGFPGSICCSVNDEVIHGIPSKKRKIQEGDIVKIDVGAFYNGYHGDCAATFAAGVITPVAKELIEVTRQSFYEGIKFARPGYRISDIARAIQEYNESHGFGVVREYVGHGIGRNLHEEPEVPNYWERGHGARLAAGMTLAIEPMVNQGGYDVKRLSDGWTVKTADGSLSSHFENTIVITEGEPIILTTQLAEEVN